MSGAARGPVTSKSDRNFYMDLWRSEAKHYALLDNMRRESEANLPPLPSYTGPGDCPKCAGTAIGTRLCRKWESKCREVEHIHRDCARCGHGWLEAPLDAPGAPT